MITKLTLERFKCFNAPTEFSFSKINILTGINGRGKSTLLQSLLLLSQSVRKNDKPNTLYINGEWVKLGSFDDLIHSDSTETNFKFDVELDSDESAKHRLKFEYSKNDENDRIALLTGLEIDMENYFEELTLSTGEDLTSESTADYHLRDGNRPKSLRTTDDVKPIQAFKNFQFISADRLGPTDFVRKWDETSETLTIGTRGENVINVLAHYGKKVQINKNKCYKDEVDDTLIKQTIAWLSFVMEGANIRVEEIESSSLLSLLLGADKNDKHLFKPYNIGFGYSYVLPLIVAGLMAKKGDVVIVENPEAHLHPAAQSRLIQFFATVATDGIQLFIETHSEHVVNAIRLMVLQPEVDLTSEAVSIYFFDNTFRAIQLKMDSNAQIDIWPDGFFNQQEKDLSQILKLGLLK